MRMASVAARGELSRGVALQCQGPAAGKLAVGLMMSLGMVAALPTQGCQTNAADQEGVPSAVESSSGLKEEGDGSGCPDPV